MEQEQNLPTASEAKKRLYYILLGLPPCSFFGGNSWYAGDKKSAIIKIILTCCFVTAWVPALWSLIEICVKKADVNGNPFV